MTWLHNLDVNPNNTDVFPHWNLAKLLLLMYVFIFHVIDHIDALRPIQDACLVFCDKCNLKKYRDDGYYTHVRHKTFDVSKCSLTTWELSHLATHTFIGYHYGLRVSLTIGVGFEIFEHAYHDCGSILDVGWNTIGALIGIYLRSIW